MMGEKYHGKLSINVIGEPNVGKSWICNRFCRYIDIPSPSVGIEYNHSEINDKNGKRYKIELWNMHHRSYKHNEFLPYPGNAAMLLIFDITCKTSFDCVLEDVIDVIVARIQHCPVIVVGNKCDCEEQRTVSSKRVQIICDEIGIQYIEVSAKDDINIDFVFQELLESAKNLELIQAIKTVRYM